MTKKLGTIAIGSDHAGLNLKNALKNYLPQAEWIDVGTHGSDRVDYPDYAQSLAKMIASGEVSRGVLICGTGAGMCVAANRFKRVRASVCTYPTMARCAREHDDINVLCLGAHLTAAEMAFEILDVFLEIEAMGGRYAQRVLMLDKTGFDTLTPIKNTNN